MVLPTIISCKNILIICDKIKYIDALIHTFNKLHIFNFRGNDNSSRMNVEVDKTNILINLLKASRRTVIYTESNCQSSLIAGAMYGAKCGISNSDNKPSRLHYVLTTLQHQGIVSSWIQNGHDGCPQRAGFPCDMVAEVYNLWFQQGSVDFLQNELGKIDFEGDMVDLLLVFGNVPASGVLTSKITRMPLGTMEL